MNGEVLERITSRARALNVPLGVHFEVTHRCNLVCKHCYNTDHADHGELSFDEICRVLDELASAGTMFVSFTGGEVLSRTDFLDILDAAHARGFAPKVLSNATLITDQVADRFARAGVLEASVSVYARDPAAHDQVTGMPGSHARTMAGIARLRARGIHVVMKTPVLTYNAGLAHDVHALAQAQSIPCIFDLAISPKTNADPAPLALQLQHRHMVDLMTQPSFSHALLAGDGDGPGPEPCNAGRSYCAISPTGDVMPCVMLPVVMGNLRTRAFADIWRSDSFVTRLRALDSHDLHACGPCDVKGSCSRCPGRAFQRGQDIDGCDLSAKAVARARVEARSRLRVLQ